MKRNLFSAVLAVWCAVFVSEQAAYAQKIYLLIAADTKHPTIGQADMIDKSNIYLTFCAQVPESQLEVYGSVTENVSWKGPSIEQADDMKSAILDAIDRCPAGNNDTIVFYWSGHGAFDDGGHYLMMPSQKPLYRREIVTAIQRKSPRLAVVISDSCNTYFDSSVLGPPRACAAPVAALRISPLFDQLFIRQKGLVDINAASKDQTAGCLPTCGGFFTAALASWEEAYDEHGRPTGKDIELEVVLSSGNRHRTNVPPGFFWEHLNERKNWNDLVAYVDHVVRTKWNKETEQTVCVWVMPAPVEHLADPHREDIPSVLSLTRNDVILSVNGMPVNNKDACIRAVNASGKTMKFTVRDSRDGTVWRMQTRLRNAGLRFGVWVEDANGGGALVTHVARASPATSNAVLERVTPGAAPPNGGLPQTLSLSRGDVILSINGTPVINGADCIRLVKSSGRSMQFTVRDNRDGTVWRMRTELGASGFGVNPVDAQGGGAYIIRVVPGFPATNNQVMERVSGPTR